MKWTERKIGRVLARNTFRADLCVLPNCTWTGDEIDLLVVTPNLRVIDVEIKISRADLKKDREKIKWWRTGTGWPRKVWKHYYAMPAELWHDDLKVHINTHSGVLLLHNENPHRLYVKNRGEVSCAKRARPNRDAETLTAAHVVQVARLASLRMWDAYLAAEKANDVA